MRILHLISSGGMYGAENMLLNLSRSLVKFRCEVTVGVFNNRHKPHLEIAEHLRENAVTVEKIPCNGQVDWAAVLRIRQLIQMLRIDIVHSHGYKGDIYSFFATRFGSTPLVATAHNWTGKTQIPPIYNRLDRLVLRRFSRVAAVSDEIARVLTASGVKRERIARISNGIDLDLFESAPPPHRSTNGQVVGMVGRLVKDKGCDYFLRAAKEVLPKFPNTKFAIVGEGPERLALEKLAHELQVENSVVFYGHRTNMPTVYAGLDICVLPSFVEGMPMTVLEAMAAAKPVIATCVGQIPELVESEASGLLVDPGNIDQLSGALAKLLADPMIGWKMGEHGRQKARKFFSADTMARGYLALYHQLVGNEARHGHRSNEGTYHNLVG